MQRGNEISEKTKRSTFTVSWLKKTFSIRATLFKGKAQ